MMNISGVGFRMDTGITRQYDNLNPQFKAMDVANHANRTEASGEASQNIPIDVKKAVADMNQDSDLKEFAVFVRSGEVPNSAAYSEDWMRPVENFAL